MLQAAWQKARVWQNSRRKLPLAVARFGIFCMVVEFEGIWPKMDPFSPKVKQSEHECRAGHIQQMLT